ncbi:hydrolase TatD [Sulfolobus sp. C3]|nr:hydrolase TatD [Sulfolobus sp. C3]
MLIDSHAHIDVSEFDQDRNEIVNECEIIIVNAGVDFQSNVKTLELSKMYKNVVPAIGFHPEFIKEKYHEVDKCLELTDHGEIISEVGLDYFWIKENEYKRKQVEVLQKFLEKAEKQSKPVIIHIRGGMNDFLNIISSYKVKFVVHAYEGNTKTANQIIELGGMISFQPIIKRDKYRQRVAQEIPLDYILTETDSPFMSAEKMVRNKPCNVKIVIEELSKLKNLSEDEVKEKVVNNFSSLLRGRRITTS